MASLATTANSLIDHYLPLIKSRQTILLALTGLAGYLCIPPKTMDWMRFAGLAGSLFVTISGCTVINMLLDRDIDRKMERTRHRPLAAGDVEVTKAATLGIGLMIVGLCLAALLSLPYFTVILIGACLNVLVYTVWLKRQSAWSILWGGVAGGMPVLAGRVLAIGRIDLLGVLLALVIVCWIPSHNLTLSMIYSEDYMKAGVPTVLNRYGDAVTHFSVMLSSLLVSVLIMFVFVLLDINGYTFGIFLILSLCLVSLAAASWVKPSAKLLTVQYKYSSIYLLLSTLLLVFRGL